jgi:hypothetical protein
MSEVPVQYESKAVGDAVSPTVLAREAVMEALISVGIDVSSPTELQADLYYLRRLRRGADEMRSVVRKALISLVVSGVIFLLWKAFKDQLIH